MPVTTRTPQSNTSPSAGGHEFDSHNNSGGSDSYSVQSSNGDPGQNDSSSSRWFNFAPVSGAILSIRVRFDWSIIVSCDASVSDNGSAAADYSVTIDAPGGGVSRGGSVNISGPGPVDDSDPTNDGGSYDQTITPSTPINSIDIEITTSAHAESGIVGSTGQSIVNVSVSISNIQIEVTTQDGGVIVIM